jgi:hypothetical protein
MCLSGESSISAETHKNQSQETQNMGAKKAFAEIAFSIHFVFSMLYTLTVSLLYALLYALKGFG